MKKSRKEKKYPLGERAVSIAEETAVFYRYSNLREILGGEKAIAQKISNETDLIALARKGIKLASVQSVSKHLALPMWKMSELLHTTHRNFQRKKKNEILNPYISEQTIEIAQVISRGIEVFGSKEEFNEWLNAPMISFGNQPPINFLDTTFGTQLIFKELGRLQHGVYS